MPAAYTLLTVLPATQLVSTPDEFPVFVGEVGVRLDPTTRRDGQWTVLRTLRYHHNRADPAVGREWFGVPTGSVHQLAFQSLHMHAMGEAWTAVGFLDTGLYSDLQATPTWRDWQTTGGLWFNRALEHWTWGLGAMAVQRPDRFLAFPLVSFARAGDRLQVSGTLPTLLTVRVDTGAVKPGFELRTLAGTYHLTAGDVPDTYVAYTTVLMGPIASWEVGPWTLKAHASWLPYRMYRKVVEDRVEEIRPARGWAFGVRVDRTFTARPDD